MFLKALPPGELARWRGSVGKEAWDLEVHGAELVLEGGDQGQ